MKTRKQFAVLGLGSFGSSLVKTLVHMGHDVLAIDVSETKVNHMVNQATQVIQADALNEEILKSLGLRNFDAVVVAIGQDIQANIVAVVILKELGVKNIVAKAQDERYGMVLEKLGVNKIIYPERDMGVRVAHSLVSSSIMDQIHLSPEYSIVEVKSTPKIAGNSLGKLNLRAVAGVNVLAIKKRVDVIVSPGADAVIDEDDILVVLGSTKAIENLSKYF